MLVRTNIDPEDSKIIVWVQFLISICNYTCYKFRLSLSSSNDTLNVDSHNVFLSQHNKSLIHLLFPASRRIYILLWAFLISPSLMSLRITLNVQSQSNLSDVTLKRISRNFFFKNYLSLFPCWYYFVFCCCCWSI